MSAQILVLADHRKAKARPSQAAALFEAQEAAVRAAMAFGEPFASLAIEGFKLAEQYFDDLGF